MELDGYLERDMLRFLDSKVVKNEKNIIDREEEYGLYLTKDYIKELNTALDNDELTRAKKLFEELKENYNRLPKESVERKKIYSMLEKMYDRIQNYIKIKEGSIEVIKEGDSEVQLYKQFPRQKTVSAQPSQVPQNVVINISPQVISATRMGSDKDTVSSEHATNKDAFNNLMMQPGFKDVKGHRSRHADASQNMQSGNLQSGNLQSGNLQPGMNLNPAYGGMYGSGYANQIAPTIIPIPIITAAPIPTTPTVSSKSNIVSGSATDSGSIGSNAGRSPDKHFVDSKGRIIKNADIMLSQDMLTKLEFVDQLKSLKSDLSREYSQGLNIMREKIFIELLSEIDKRLGLETSQEDKRVAELRSSIKHLAEHSVDDTLLRQVVQRIAKLELRLDKELHGLLSSEKSSITGNVNALDVNALDVDVLDDVDVQKSYDQKSYNQKSYDQKSYDQKSYDTPVMHRSYTAKIHKSDIVKVHTQKFDDSDILFDNSDMLIDNVSDKLKRNAKRNSLYHESGTVKVGNVDVLNRYSEDDIRMLYEQAVYYMFQGNHADAIPIFNEIVRSRPHNNSARIRLEECQQITGIQNNANDMFTTSQPMIVDKILKQCKKSSASYSSKSYSSKSYSPKSYSSVSDNSKSTESIPLTRVYTEEYTDHIHKNGSDTIKIKSSIQPTIKSNAYHTVHDTVHHTAVRSSNQHHDMVQAYAQGIYLMNNNNHAGALKIFQSIIDAKPENKAARIRLNECLDIMNNSMNNSGSGLRNRLNSGVSDNG